MAITEVLHRGSDGYVHDHRSLQSGWARAAVFGVSDGLVSNVSLILGVAGASPAPGIVRLAGLAGLVGGAVAMGAGELISVQAQRELLERELEIERRSLALRPEVETEELAGIYRGRGIDAPTAHRMASEIAKDPAMALEVHAREELGVDPNNLGSPVKAAASSLVSFVVGAFIPLLPWLVSRGNAATLASVVLGAVGALTVGATLARFTGRSMVRTALRQLAVAIVAAGFTFAVGKLIGGGTTPG